MRLLFAALLFPAVAIAAACDGAGPQLAAARKALDRDDLPSAERVLLLLRQSHADCSDLVLEMARLNAAKGDEGQAEILFFRYGDLAPKDARGRYYFARFLFGRRSYPRAAALADEAVALDPAYAPALTLKGKMLAMRGQGQAAEETLRKAVSIEPNNAEARFELGSLFDSMKRNIDAVEQFQKVVGLNPRDARAWDYLALNLEPLGEVERASEAYKKGLAVNEPPRFDSFLDYNYGRFLTKRNQLVESKKHLDRAVELTPNVRAVFYERAKTNLQLKNFQAARSDAEKALSLDDRAGIIIDLQVYYLLETIYRRLGEKELADKYAALARTTPVPPRKQRQ